MAKFYLTAIPGSKCSSINRTIKNSTIPTSTPSLQVLQAAHADVRSGIALAPITASSTSATNTTRLQKSVITTSEPSNQSSSSTPFSTVTSTVPVSAGMV